MTDTKRFDESMNDLRSQIDALHIDDEDSKRRLSALVDDIDRTLRASNDVPTQVKLGRSLSASVLHFEVSHPRIAAVLNQLAEKLSDIGI